MIGILVSEDSLKVLKFKPYAGSLVVFSDAVWNAPTGEKVQGLISYEPASGKVSYLIPPDSQNASVITPGMYWNNHALAVQRSATTTNLVSLDLATQTTKTIDSLPSDEGTFGQALWSADGSRVAYVVYSKTGGTSLRVSGESADKIVFGVPLAFSPDASQLLVDARPVLHWVDVASGTSGNLEGVDVTSTTGTTRVSLSGNYLLTVQQGEPVAKVYRIDWKTHTATPDGVIPMPEESDLALNAHDQVLVTPKSGLSKAYQLSDEGTHGLVGLYDFKLPESVHIISWNTP
jgi:hypothetical protein